MGILQARILEWLPFPPSGDLPNPGIKARSPVLQADSLPSESPGKPIVTYIYTIWWMFLLSHSVSAMEGIESYAYLGNYYLRGVEKKTIVGWRRFTWRHYIIRRTEHSWNMCPHRWYYRKVWDFCATHIILWWKKNITLAKSSCINILLTCRICNNKWIICYYKFIIPNLTESICPL